MVIKMRDPKRIDLIVTLLADAWKKYPDLRFWQLLLNISWNYEGDFFFMEDDKVLSALERVRREGL